jgi:hypothetical protein
MAEDLATWEMDEERYLTLLGKLVGESEHLQNNPPDLVPTEDRGRICERRRVAVLLCRRRRC